MKRLQTMREFRKLSRADLAQQLGVTVSQIQKWEDGEEQPTDEQLITIAAFFECPVSTFRHSINNELLEKTTSLYSDNAIKCPHCGSRSLAFVTEYHKSIGLRVIELVLTVWIFIALLSHIPNILYNALIAKIKFPSSAQTEIIDDSAYASSIFDNNLLYPAQTTSDIDEEIETSIIAIVIPVIFYYLVKLAIYGIESKTHVQAICKDCGNLWLLN